MEMPSILLQKRMERVFRMRARVSTAAPKDSSDSSLLWLATWLAVLAMLSAHITHTAVPAVHPTPLVTLTGPPLPHGMRNGSNVGALPQMRREMIGHAASTGGCHRYTAP